MNPSSIRRAASDSRALRLIALASALAFTGAPLTARAQGRPGAALPDRLSPATRATIERLADSLEAERLPAAALRDKAAEGALKGADEARILGAVQSLASRLRESRVLLGASARDDELVASASALYAGVPGRGIAGLAATSRKHGGAPGGLGVPLTVLAELSSARVPPDVALRSVETLLSRGARDVDFAVFRRGVERDVRQGRAPRDAVSSSMQSTLRGIGRVP